MSSKKFNLQKNAVEASENIADALGRGLFISGAIWIGAYLTSDPLDMHFLKFWLLLSGSLLVLKSIGGLFKSKVGA